jgi:di/tricarboxylate transporter
MIVLVTIILLIAVTLLVTEMVPVDVTAFGIIVVLTVSGILTPAEAVAGFASPAVLTVAAMFMISRGMIRAGAVGFLGQYLLKLSKGSPVLAMALILGVVGIASAFINNTPIVVLFIPIVLSITCKLGLSPSKYLIPISYISILGGTCTLIGTSTNIIVSDLSTAHGTGAISMFELAGLGVPIALIGFLFLLTAAPKWMPNTLNPVCELENHDNRRYLAEFNVPTDSPIVGHDPIPFFQARYPSLEVIDLIRYDHVFHPNRDHMTVSPDDILLIKSSANDLVDILHEGLVDLPLSEAGIDFSADQQASLIVELIIPPESTLIGNRLIESRLSRETDLHVIAIKRRELHYTEAKMQDARLKTGDILLVRCPESTLEDFRSDTDFIIVEDVHHEIIHKRLALRAAVIFAAMVAAASSGLADILVCALAAAFLMIACKCLPLRDAYRAIESRVLMIIIGTIALSAALEKTGASNVYAHAFLNLFADASPGVVLCGIVLLTSLSTQVLSNNATAVLLFPIALATAQGLGVSPKPFIVAICFGASACFATPIGYQTNLLVYGPGGYRFTDYLRLGIPLNVLVLVMGSVFIPMFWPF